MRHRRALLTAAWKRIRQRISRRDRIRHAKGRENEARVEKALVLLQEEGAIIGYFFSVPNDARDRKGIDAGLTTVQGTEINFQIKSSDRGMQRHLRKYPDIPCVNVHGCVSVSDIAVLIRTQFKLS